MTDLRRIVARIANLGLAVFGLATVTILGTGGTEIHLASFRLGLHGLANPLQGLFFFAALRVLFTRHGFGLEGRLVRFYARQGLAPRHTAATRGSAAVAGGWLGAGAGLVLALCDLAHLLLTAPHPAPTTLEALSATAIDAAFGVLAGGILGGLAGILLLIVLRALSLQPRRYELGRWIGSLLIFLAPLVVRFAPGGQGREMTPLLLLTMAFLVLVFSGMVFLLLPAAYLRARRGRWGVAVSGSAVLALAIGALAVGAFKVPASRASAGGGSVHQNILILSVTGMRADGLGLYGDGFVATPNIDALAQQGAVFERAITPSASAAEAAASLLTGLYPVSHGLRAETSWRWKPESLTELVRSHGYRTGAFVGWRALDGAQTGLAELFEDYSDLTVLRDWLDRLALSGHLSQHWQRPKAELRPAAEVVESFREWVTPISEAPWMAWLEFAGPLRPAIWEGEGPGDPEASASDPLPLPPAWARPEQASQSLDAWFRSYQREIFLADHAVGSVLELLRARGELHRTLVILTAEHGISLGEGGTWFEVGQALPEGVIHVPFILYVPGAVQGRSIPGPASLVDVVPTVLGLMGLAGGNRCEGEDLSRYLLDTDGAPRDSNSGPVFSESASRPQAGGRLHAVRFGTWKLVGYPDGKERFYEIASGEREIISSRGRQGRMRQDLSDMLTRRLAQGTWPR